MQIPPLLHPHASAGNNKISKHDVFISGNQTRVLVQEMIQSCTFILGVCVVENNVLNCYNPLWFILFVYLHKKKQIQTKKLQIVQTHGAGELK